MLARHIQYFLAVAEHQGFTKAAAALHVSQPALSQQVRQLEESLGAQLFDFFFAQEQTLVRLDAEEYRFLRPRRRFR